MASIRTVRRHGDKYNFVGDTATGLTFRWGRTLKEDPDMAPWPELADISISNRCSKGCSFCYRDSAPNGNLMTLNEYRFVLDQLTSPTWGTVFQVAIGGGEPTEHPQLIEILKETRCRGVVPNLTTNGEALSDEHIYAFKELCGAVAVSVASIKPSKIKRLISRLIKADVRTNIHFLMSRKSLPTAIDLLKGQWDQLFQGLNAVIFLTYKAMGRANYVDSLSFNNDLRTFLSLINHPSTKLRFGFDACFVPLLLRYTNADTRFIDSCECGFFSVYIDDQLNVKPCSFSLGDEFSFNLSDYDFGTIWQTKFEPYRELVRNLCHTRCDSNGLCRGGCPYHESVNLCRVGR